MEICIFNVFLGSLLNFDKEKWYYMYTEQILKNDVFFIFCHNFVTLILNLVLSKTQHFYQKIACLLHLKISNFRGKAIVWGGSKINLLISNPIIMITKYIKKELQPLWQFG